MLQVTVPLQPVAVIVSFSSPHTLPSPLRATVGGVGAAPVVTVTSLLFAEVPHSLLQVAE